MKISRVIPKQDKKILTCFHTVLECKSFTRIILITVKDEPQCCSIACYSFSKILWGSFTAMSWCLTIIGIVVLSARSRSKSCKKKMNLLRPALRHFVFTWLQQRQAVVCVCRAELGQSPIKILPMVFEWLYLTQPNTPKLLCSQKFGQNWPKSAARTGLPAKKP